MFCWLSEIVDRRFSIVRRFVMGLRGFYKIVSRRRSQTICRTRLSEKSGLGRPRSTRPSRDHGVVVRDHGVSCPISDSLTFQWLFGFKFQCKTWEWFVTHDVQWVFGFNFSTYWKVICIFMMPNLFFSFLCCDSTTFFFQNESRLSFFLWSLWLL